MRDGQVILSRRSSSLPLLASQMNRMMARIRLDRNLTIRATNRIESNVKSSVDLRLGSTVITDPLTLDTERRAACFVSYGFGG